MNSLSRCMLVCTQLYWWFELKDGRGRKKSHCIEERVLVHLEECGKKRPPHKKDDRHDKKRPHRKNDDKKHEEPDKKRPHRKNDDKKHEEPDKKRPHHKKDEKCHLKTERLTSSMSECEEGPVTATVHVDTSGRRTLNVRLVDDVGEVFGHSEITLPTSSSWVDVPVAIVKPLQHAKDQVWVLLWRICILELSYHFILSFYISVGLCSWHYS